MPAPIVVWSERPALRVELLGQARRLADKVGAEVHLCLETDEDVSPPESYGVHGADLVYSADTTQQGPVAFLAQVVAGSDPGLVLIGATKTGMEVAPRLAERCGAGYAAWAVGIEIDPANGGVSASCMLYAGSGIAEYRFSRPVTVLSVAQGTFQAWEEDGRVARLQPVVCQEEPHLLTVTGERPKSSSRGRLQEARSVVDVGRGVKSPQDLDLVRSLAELLDAQVGCSRPVSSDRDWFPEWLGLSGAKVKPELCVTIGVSGAVQHVVGIRDSRIIAAVNNDENAAIFAQADVGVVADLNEFLPVLMERLKSKGARPAWL